MKIILLKYLEQQFFGIKKIPNKSKHSYFDKENFKVITFEFFVLID